MRKLHIDIKFILVMMQQSLQAKNSYLRMKKLQMKYKHGKLFDTLILHHLIMIIIILLMEAPSFGSTKSFGKSKITKSYPRQ